MPWNIDKLGNKNYKLSLFAKEELPTWGEMIEVWNKQELFYDPNKKDQQELDIYWKVPRHKFLIAVMYNQLNKMIFEDKFDYVSSFKDMKYEKEDCKVTDMRFACTLPPQEGTSIKDLEKWATTFFCGTSCQPPIITIPMPTGEENPFITNNYSRININDLSYMEIIPVVMFDTDSYKNIMAIVTPDFKNGDYFTYNSIMSLFMKHYEEYFRDPVGWKDVSLKQVSIIGSDITSHCK